MYVCQSLFVGWPCSRKALIRAYRLSRNAQGVRECEHERGVIPTRERKGGKGSSTRVPSRRGTGDVLNELNISLGSSEKKQQQTSQLLWVIGVWGRGG